MLRNPYFTETFHPQRQRWAAGIVASLAVVLGLVAACNIGEGDGSVSISKTDGEPQLAVAGEPRPALESTSPGSVEPRVVTYAEAESAFSQRDFDKAVELFTLYVERRPENAWGHYMLGMSAWKSGDLEGARTAFGTALSVDPTHVKSLINLGRVLLQAELPEEAVPHVAGALELDSASVDARRVMGRVLAALGRTDEALDSYREALILTPTDVWSMNNMGLVLIRAGRYEEAIGPLARAVQLDSGTAVFRNNLGIALERSGYPDHAAEAYRQALALDSSYTRAQVSLARIEGAVRPGEPEPVGLDLRQVAEEFAAVVQFMIDSRSAAALPPVGSTAADTVVEETADLVEKTAAAVEKTPEF